MIPHSALPHFREKFKIPVLQCLWETLPQTQGTTGQAHIGESHAEQGYKASFHTSLHRLHHIQLLHPWAFSSLTRWANGEISDQPMKGSRVMNHCNAVSWFSAVSMLALSHFCHFSMLPLSLLTSQISSAEPQWPLATTSTGFSLPQFWAPHPCEPVKQPRAEHAYRK